ncbi:nucleotide exchange factor GrpE [Weissella muntiaci]|jgi:molecular chaperone GrpE|uniref:Protein GrpE n=1 Tax=Weissella muntiaci TaxID=2508881 RepID=A0A6C2C3G9_9LACO|nr:nucleotide exchange factor GrpE [Weissella muntiaci]TYC48086.1 nucleotide exchange factor GrpE [Weissella muntiaci]
MAENKNSPEQQDEEVLAEIVEDDATEAVVAEIDEIAELETKLAEAEDKFLRARAEMQNIKVRSEREQAQAVKFAAAGLAKSILPAVDNLERALQVETNDEAAQQIKTGVEMVFKTLNQALEDNGIAAVGTVGEPFDPNFHQAIQSVPADDDHPADTIATVLQKGYVLADRVIRPAMVAVYN